MPENELTRKAEIQMSPVTNGPCVNQYMQTSAPCVFACGNVVHVNDLVDNVTTESMQAGRCAAKYAMGALEAGERTVRAVPGENVRYLCPQNIVSGTHSEDKVTLFFRVLAPDKQVRIVARSGDRELASRKALRVNPGEMEHIQISAKDLSEDVVVEIQKEA